MNEYSGWKIVISSDEAMDAEPNNINVIKIRVLVMLDSLKSLKLVQMSKSF